MKKYLSAIALTACLLGNYACVKVKETYPAPSLTFSNDYTASAYHKVSRVYQDTIVPLTNKIIMTANCASLAGIQDYQVSLNGNIINNTTIQFQDFNQEIDTMYLPAQTTHTDNWEFSFTDQAGRTLSKQIHITIK
jgi:hypothetical protein